MVNIFIDVMETLKWSNFGHALEPRAECTIGMVWGLTPPLKHYGNKLLRQKRTMVIRHYGNKALL